MLTDLEKEKIRLEETYRDEVKKIFEKKEPKKSFGSAIFSFFNSALGLWLLSAIFITGGLKIYEDYKENAKDIKENKEVIDKLNLEISYRYSRLLVNLYELTDKNLDQEKMSKDHNTEEVKKLALSLNNPTNSIGSYLYPEYATWSLLTLLAELKRHFFHLKKEDRQLDQVIHHITGIEVFFEVKKVDFSDIRKIAGYIQDELILPRWKNNGFYFLDGSSNSPFP